MNMTDLTGAERAAVRAIMRGHAIASHRLGRLFDRGLLADALADQLPRLAWSYRDHLIADGHGAETLAKLVEAQWLAAWSLDDQMAFTLTPLAAEVAHVEIDETASEKPVWRRRGRKKLPFHARKHDGTLPLPETIPDRAPGPEQEAEDAEEYLMTEVRHEDGRPLYDPATGKVVKEPVVLFGQRVRKDPRMARKRPKPKRARATR